MVENNINDFYEEVCYTYYRKRMKRKNLDKQSIIKNLKKIYTSSPSHIQKILQDVFYVKV